MILLILCIGKLSDNHSTRVGKVVKANSAEKVFFSSDRFLHWAILLINWIEGTLILKLAFV
jgi:hypothetical protein